MRTMTFNLLPRYHTGIWQDRTISGAFLEFFDLCRSMRSHISFQVVELLQQCHFYSGDPYSLSLLLRTVDLICIYRILKKNLS